MDIMSRHHQSWWRMHLHCPWRRSDCMPNEWSRRWYADSKLIANIDFCYSTCRVYTKAARAGEGRRSPCPESSIRHAGRALNWAQPEELFKFVRRSIHASPTASGEPYVSVIVLLLSTHDVLRQCFEQASCELKCGVSCSFSSKTTSAKVTTLTTAFIV